MTHPKNTENQKNNSTNRDSNIISNHIDPVSQRSSLARCRGVQPPAHPELESGDSKSCSTKFQGPKFHSDLFNRFLIHRTSEPIETQNGFYSNVRAFKIDVPTITEEQERSNPKDIPTRKQNSHKNQKEFPRLKTKYPVSDIIFANGNNREKRRGEVFQHYSELYKYQDQYKDQLYIQQTKRIRDKLEKLNFSKDFHLHSSTPISHYQDVDRSLYEKDLDIIEKRDFELTRLKAMRNLRRNQNLKNYKIESFKVYKASVEAVDKNLEKMKIFLEKQKGLLNNLDKDFTEIGAARAEKFYSGFKIKNITDSNSNNETSDTDVATHFSSVGSNGEVPTIKITNEDNPKLLLSSVMEGYNPLITDNEFKIITDGEFESLNPSFKVNRTLNGIDDHKKGNISETDGGGTSNLEDQKLPAALSSSTRRRPGRPTNSSRTTISISKPSTTVISNSSDRRSEKSSNWALNRIMKHYSSPDILKENEIEEDMKIFKKITEKARKTENKVNRI
ncbi:hypothetical protein WICMUC_003563 [Wickerhamomyces mucosus]|uniref:Uncharacterized protein n=1 Tax=Wickerhamomyces mucosus TaxID=1378264 RepID=A0A9P8PLA5_9ASCO|nr:hypothetical protein WICMUC_003563 [Wickerhamomyces mucosus]